MSNTIREREWVEFHYYDGDTDITISGVPSLVIEAADGLPTELVDVATVYVDEDESGEKGHLHILTVDMGRNPDGSWQW